MTLFLKDFKLAGCSITDQFDDLDFDPSDYATKIKSVVIAPSSRLPEDALERISATLFSPQEDSRTDEDGVSLLQQLNNSVHAIDGNIGDFISYFQQNYKNITPGGLFLGDNSTPPTFAYKANANIREAIFVQNALDTVLTNVSISTTYRGLDIPFPGSAGNSLQLVTYFGLAMAVYPALLALYPTFERIRSIRQLHYSNGMHYIGLCLFIQSMPLFTESLKVCVALLYGLPIPLLTSELFSQLALFRSSSYGRPLMNGTISNISSWCSSAMDWPQPFCLT